MSKALFLDKEELETLLDNIVVRTVREKEVRVVDIDVSEKVFGKEGHHQEKCQLTWFHSLEASMLDYTFLEEWCFWMTPCFQEFELKLLLERK